MCDAIISRRRAYGFGIARLNHFSPFFQLRLEKFRLVTERRCYLPLLISEDPAHLPDGVVTVINIDYSERRNCQHNVRDSIYFRLSAFRRRSSRIIK